MAGNVWEWCWDWYGSYSIGSQTDPHGPSGPAAWGSTRVIRGGSWYIIAANCRVAYRNNSSVPDYGDNGYGFRSALPSGQP